MVKDHGEDRWWLPGYKQFRLEIATIATNITEDQDPFVGCSSCGKETVLDSQGRTLCCGKIGYSISLEGSL